MVMADRGFTIEEELAARGATLKIPAFTKNKKQKSAKAVNNYDKISNVLIHVEGVIGRTKKIIFLIISFQLKWLIYLTV